MIFKNLKNIMIPEGNVARISKGDVTLWKKHDDLPYIPLAYIESDGSQWIDTGLQGGLDTFGVVLKMEKTKYGAYYLLGNFNQAGQCGLMVSPKDRNNVSFVYYVGATAYNIALHEILSPFYFSNIGRKLAVNGEFVGTLPDDTQKLKNSKLMLFGTGVGTKFNSGGKIFYLKIYGDILGSEQVRNFIPVLDPSGKPCMYDTLTRQPFYNQGTGEFGYELMDGTYVAPV